MIEIKRSTLWVLDIGLEIGCETGVLGSSTIHDVLDIVLRIKEDELFIFQMDGKPLYWGGLFMHLKAEKVPYGL